MQGGRVWTASRPLRGLCTAVAFAGLLSACASSFQGIALKPGAADPDLQALAHRARDGEKHSLLALGIRFEEGRGVPRDLARAKRLYRLAAADSRPAYVYSPPVSKGDKGRMIPLEIGLRQPGLAEARERLARLD